MRDISHLHCLSVRGGSELPSTTVYGLVVLCREGATVYLTLRYSLLAGLEPVSDEASLSRGTACPAGFPYLPLRDCHSDLEQARLIRLSTECLTRQLGRHSLQYGDAVLRPWALQ